MGLRMSGDRPKLQGFNNLTKVVSFNLYDFFVARTDAERDEYVRWIDTQFSAARTTEILRGIADIIDAEVLSVSARDYDPHGTSALVLMSDLGIERSKEDRAAATVAAHLDKSHLEN